MKKTLLVLSALMAVGVGAGLASCGGSGKTLEVFVQTADHGWTGAVQSYAQEKVNELNAEGKYEVKLTACENATDEANKIQDVLTRGKDAVHGIVLLPIDATMESTINKIVDSGIPFTQFDRVVSSEKIDNAENRVSNVLGDNYGIGVATAERMLDKGLTKEDKILIMPGDNSSVPTSRNNGFFDTLKEAGWTQEEIDAACTSTDYTGWSRTKARELFVAQGDKLLNYDWVFTHDSEIAMGILEELNANNVSAAVKEHFKTGIKGVASSSGLDEMYAVLEGDHKTDYLSLLGENTDLFDVTYDPAMIKIAIQDMVDHLDGKTVEKQHVVPVEVVDKTNVTEYKGFGTGDYRK